MNVWNILGMKIGSVIKGIRLSEPSSNAQAVATDVQTILQMWVGPLFAVLGALGIVYIVILAVQYAKSENDSKKAETKSRMVNLAIGVVCLIILAVLCLNVNLAYIADVFGYTEKN